MKPMEITMAEDGDHKCRMTMAGAITLRTLPGIRQEMLHQLGCHQEMEVDLSGVAVVDTEGVRAILAIRREAARENKALRFVSRNEAFLQLLDSMNRVFFGAPLAA